MRGPTLADVARDRTTSILLVCGAGGVGKTTVAAAVAVRAAEAGRRAVVLTIDPARRLATSLGLDRLGNDPQPVPGIDATAGGSLDAMMLDMARTFDDAVRASTTPARAEQLLANPFYQAVANNFSGTQEYMAMEKLGELAARSAGRWDLIVVDTPPSASALDFLDGPRRLTSLLDSPALRTLTAPTRGSLRFLGAGVAIVNQVLDALVGRRSLADLQIFVGAFETLLGGFRERAEATRARLSRPGTACLVVTTGESASLAEAGLLLGRLAREGIAVRGLVANRVEPDPGPVDDERAAAHDPLAGWAREAMMASRERREDELRFTARQAGDNPLIVVARQRREPTDVATLRAVAGD